MPTLGKFVLGERIESLVKEGLTKSKDFDNRQCRRRRLTTKVQGNSHLMSQEPRVPEIPLSVNRRPISLLALGFRPFFLGAGASAFFALAMWLLQLHGWFPGEGYFTGPFWHAHEMLFGYAAAVIAGFLLTAVRNWTGMPVPTGRSLGALAGLWLAARIAPFLPVPDFLVAALNLAFFPAVAIGLARPLWNGPNPNNRLFVGLLAGMTVASLLVHLQALGLAAGTGPKGERLMLDLVLLTLLVVAGRIMPFFTQGAIAGVKPVTRPLVERLTFGLAIALLGVDLIQPLGPTAGAIALALAAVQAVRLMGWHDKRVWSLPLMAVLYAGYIWLIAGYALTGLAGFGAVSSSPALHALTVGAVGVFTLGMMARVTLGHTGRQLRSSVLTNAAFLLLNAAALVRVLLPLVMPQAYPIWLDLSGTLWVLAFGLFLWVHAPMLVSPRADGRPG